VRFAWFMLSTALPLAAIAQERPNTMLVLDGSGSMWGQIDGINKIVIAREVLGTILDDFPAGENIGLTVYGHRRRGDCTDIETVVPSGAGTLDAIREAANAINPRGRTPMTDAVIAAAEALRYTEEEATVVLVSDGIETCNPDPCAAARALEEAGIGFTAHVVGFDVTDPEALAQMQCLADETGGTFITASNAAELTSALQRVTVAAPEPVPAPEPAIAPITFAARIGGEDGPAIADPVIWSLPDMAEQQGNPVTYELAEGSYTVEAYWTAQEVAQSRQFVATGAAREIVLVFDEPAPTATVTAPATAPLGATVEIGWNGPEAQGDYIGIGPEGAEGAARWENFVYVDGGGPKPLLMSPREGPHVIGYFDGAADEMIGSAVIELTPVESSIIAPAEAPAGADAEIGWTGPDYAGDYVGVGPVGATGADRWQSFAYTRDGSPARLTMPAVPGDYVVTYFMSQDQTPLAAAAMTVTEQGATIAAPAEARAGETVEVVWTGPDLAGDYIGVGPVGASGPDRWENFAYTSDGAPARLVMPPTPGDYAITYFMAQDRTPLVETTISVGAQEAAITAPAAAPAGSRMEIAWTGPGLDGDYLGIGPVGAAGADRWRTFVYTSDGSPARILIPSDPGAYEITYFMAQDRTPLASVPLTVSEVAATLDAPERAPAGGTLEVGWTGPDYPGDYVGIGRADATGSARWQSWAYTADGNPAVLTLPEESGAYVLRYFMDQDGRELVSRPVVLE
jgi:Ca-activated chloride channel family protein